MDSIKYINLDYSHRSSSAKNIFSDKKKSNLKIMNNFKKINSLFPANTSGKQPIIIYKKEMASHTIKTSSNNNNTISSNKNTYISDGGLKKKLEKYHHGHSRSIPNHLNKKKSQSTKNCEKTKKIYKIKKNFNTKIAKNEKEKEKEKKFSQTFISDFRRPNHNNNYNIKKQKNNEIKEKNKENKKKKKNLAENKNMSESCMIDNENKKLERMNKLVENAIVYEMRKSQFDTEKITFKDKINYKKKGYLEHNGIETGWTIDEEMQEKEKKNDNKINSDININNPINKTEEEKKEFKNKLKKKLKQENNSININNNRNSHTILINSNSSKINNEIQENNYFNNNTTLESIKQPKPILKPKVNQFEFLQKIQEEKKKLPLQSNNLNISTKINDSFRHKSITLKPKMTTSSEKKNSKEYQNKQNTKYKTIVLDENINDEFKEFPYADKKNHRTIEELIEYTRKKKIKAKKEEEKKEYKKKKKLFETYKNLSNLKESYNNNQSANFNNNYNISIGVNNISNNNYSISIPQRRNKNRKVKKYKEVNAYYIGTDSSRSGSTILDSTEFYLNILESQQLVVNSKFNKIYDFAYNNNNDYINIYNNNNEEVKVNNYLNENDLNKEVNKVIKRANDLFILQNAQNEQNDLINIQENEIFQKTEKSTKNQRKKEKKLEEINLENINNDAININMNNNNLNLNKINTSSERNTKEKELPSLPHTFSNINNSNSNSNQNRKIQVDVDIQPCNVFNLVETLRLIFQRKFFYRLCQLYINQSFSQRYILAISYFVAICKHYPFKILVDYCIYKTYYYAFRQLFRPFTRKYFKMFLINCISITKVGYFVESLARMFKFKAMEKIYIYSQMMEEQQLKKICNIILKIILPLIKVNLKYNFQNFVNYYKQSKKEKKIKKNINLDSFEFDLTNSSCKIKRNKTMGINSYMNESQDSKSYSLHPNSVDNDNFNKNKNEKNKDNNDKKNKNEKKGNLSVNEESENIDDIDANKNNLNCPKMSKHTKINYLNPSQINNVKDDDNNNSNNTENNINKEEKEEFDISAEKDKINNNIFWEYAISPLNKSQEKEEVKEKEKDNINIINNEIIPSKAKEEQVEKEENNDDIFVDFEDISIDEEKPLEKISESKEKEKEKKPEIKIPKKIEKIIINTDEIKKEEKPKPKTLQEYFQNFPSEIITEITEDIIKELILTEIKSSENPLIPKKSFKFDTYDLNLSNNLFNSSNSFNFRLESNSNNNSFLSQQQNSLYKDNSYPNFFLNDSMLASLSASSVFNTTIKDKKKRKSLLLYKKKVFPLLIKLIKEEIYNKYDRLYESIKTPLKNNFEKIVIGLELQNSKMIKDNYKKICYKEDIKNIIDKNLILKKIEKYNKDIRNKDNLFDDNFYDKILNECVIDTCIELIKNERIYNEEGEPFFYGRRNIEIIFKYEKNKPKLLADFVIKKLYEIFNINIGLINTNYEYYTQEQLNNEKERRLINVLKNELKESEEKWQNLEIEETQLKLEITEIINEQLYNEVMEILEHITLNRKKPELYQNKSIFACEEIPKLYFQQNAYTLTDGKKNSEENDLINSE